MFELYNSGEDVPLKTYKHGRCTIGQFIDSITPHRKDYVMQPLYIEVNGQYVPSTEWDTFKIKHSDVVVATIVANGGIFKGLANIISGALNFAFGWIMPSARGPNTRYSQEQGSRIDQASIKANAAQLGEFVNEGFGTYRYYPAYLTMPRRYYKNKRTQMLEFSACIGVGHYAFDASEVRIVDTPISQIAGAVVKKYNPGESLAGDQAHFNWYTAEEVGGTSSGSPGLELSTELTNRDNTQPNSYIFNGLEVSRNGGLYPSGWGGGTTVRVSLPLSYTVAREQIGLFPDEVFYNTFTGFFNHVPLTKGSTSGVFEDWEMEVISQNGANKTVRFFRMEGELNNKKVYYNGANTGTRNYVFGDLVDRNINIFTEEKITFSSLPFPSTTSTQASISFSGGNVYGEWSGPFHAVPLGQKTNLIELDFLFNSGLMGLNDNGSSYAVTVVMEVQYKGVEDSVWQSRTFTYSEATRDQIGFTEQIYVNDMEPLVRVRRIGAEAISNSIFDAVTWYGLKAWLAGRSVYPNWTTITCSFESGGKIAAQSENRVNVIATRMLPELQPDGTWSELKPTRDIISACRYMWQSVGYTDDDAMLSEFIRLHNQFWKPRGETFDFILGRVSVKEAIDTALGAGMAVMTVDGGKIKPVRDMKRTLRMEERTYAFSDQGVMGDIAEDFKPWNSDDYDGVEVEYVDPVNFEPATVRYVLPGKPGFKLEKLKVDGITDRTRAWVVAARKAWANFVRTHRTTFRTEMMGRLTNYWCFVKIVSNDPLISQSGYVLQATSQAGVGVLWKSSERLQVEDGNTYLVGFRDLSGVFNGPYVVRRIIDGKTIVLDSGTPIPKFVNGAALPHLYFGLASEIERSFLIEEVTYNGFYEAQIKAVIYDDRVYSQDDNTPPISEF